MTQRSMLKQNRETIVIKAGASVTVRGYEGNRVTAEAKGRWGLTLGRRSELPIGRARAAIGEHVLFDLRVRKPNPFGSGGAQGEIIDVQLGGSGAVQVPFSSNLKIYAGKDINVQGVQGQVDAYGGLNVSLQDVYCLGHASAGWSMKIDCQTLNGTDVTYSAGSDLRFHVADLTSALLRVKDLGGYWEARIGAGEKTILLKSGGDVILVTDQEVEALPPDYLLGNIERPPGE